MITNAASGTNLHEIAPGIYRINTPVALPDGSGFNFNQYLVADDEPLVFHTGARGLFALVSEAIAKVLPLASIRYVAFSHFEADEKPQTLACMHGSAWRGDGAGLLRALAKSLETRALALPLAA